MANSMRENLEEERDTETPDSELGSMRLARRKLLAGETYTPDEFVETHGGSHSVLTQAVKNLKQLGFRFTTEPVERQRKDGRTYTATRYRVTNLDHVPTDTHYAAVTAAAHPRKLNRTPARHTEAPVEAERRNGHDLGVELPALPGLAESVQVYALALNDDGTVTIGVRSGARRWVATLTGAVAEEDE